MQTVLYSLQDIIQDERNKCQRQDHAPCKRRDHDVVKDTVNTGNVDYGKKHQERKTYGTVHHLVGEQTELEYRYSLGSCRKCPEELGTDERRESNRSCDIDRH